MREETPLIVLRDGHACVDEGALGSPGANTSIRFAYSDGANWKSSSEHVLTGRLSPEALRTLAANGVDGPGHPIAVYPENLGLIHPLRAEGGTYDEDLDEARCDLASVRYTDAPPSGPVCGTVSAALLEERIAAVAAHGWDEEAAIGAIVGNEALLRFVP